MRISHLGVIAALSIAGPTALSACGSDDGSEKQLQGSVSVALTGVSQSGITYRLRTGSFAITGPKAVNFGTEADLAATTRSFELPAGNYLIKLKTGWTMERFNGMGWETVEAILLSPNPAGFQIVDQERTGVVFLFRAGDDVIQLGNGVVDVSIAIDDGMTPCPAGQVMCAGVCVNPTGDPNNCGACGNVCMPGSSCQNGSCVGMGCPMGQKLCAGGCIDVGTDPNNCGACANVCPPSQSCSNGICAPLMCQPGFADCNNAAGDACETDVNNDVLNCGGCSVVCNPPQNASADCAAGTCQFSCAEPFANCDGDLQNGCEVNLGPAPTCGAQTLGPITGDVSGPSVGASGFGAHSIRLMVFENHLGPGFHDLGVMLNLTPPAGASYTMEVACDDCGATQVGNQLFVRWAELQPLELDSSRDVFVNIRYLSGSSCLPWQFQATGNVLITPPTCSAK